ncbi:hypothetical protein MAR_035787, partial [Mya arenaria]
MYCTVVIFSLTHSQTPSLVGQALETRDRTPDISVGETETTYKMATFEETATGTKGEDDMEYSKFSLRRMEPAIQKFLKVVQIDLGRLHSHKLNMERVEDGDLDSFDRKIEPVKNTALRSLAEFLPLCQKSEKQDQSSSDSSPEGEVHILGQGQGQTSTPEGEGEIKEPLLQTQLNERPENTEVAQSWEALQE